jgi:hypothetical protein
VAARGLLEELEAGDELLAPLAFLAVQAVELEPRELNAARRRALLLLAAGGDPHRALEPGGRAVRALAADLDSPARRTELADALRALRGQSAGLVRVAAALDELLVDPDLAWRWAACALLAEELADAE